MISEFLQAMLNNFAGFFSFAEFWSELADPMSWGLIGTLVMLEGLLSTDNALVLAVMVNHLPPEKQRKALFYGILGAYLFRFLAIGIGLFLIHIWWIKLIGALYLLWLPLQHFRERNQKKRRVTVKRLGFWRTVLTVEIMDIAFSIDSILAAFGVSEKVWVLYLGGILGVAMMRGVAQVFLTLLKRFPGLETAAYVLIAVIGLKMFGAAFDYHVNDALFFTTMLALFFGTVVLQDLGRGRR
ncbi:MAG: TerC family protein [Veillonellales bacterium]